jgi:hypothetical protein
VRRGQRRAPVPRSRIRVASVNVVEILH